MSAREDSDRTGEEEQGSVVDNKEEREESYLHRKKEEDKAEEDNKRMVFLVGEKEDEFDPTQQKWTRLAFL